MVCYIVKKFTSKIENRKRIVNKSSKRKKKEFNLFSNLCDFSQNDLRKIKTKINVTILYTQDSDKCPSNNWTLFYIHYTETQSATNLT